MRKLFLLIPALVLSLLANAAVINIDNTTPNAVQTALNSAASGDEIVMAAGTYEESGNYLAFTGKDLTVRAAEGAEVIIKTVCPVRLKEGAKAEFINVKFDCSTIGSYDYVIVAADDTENKRVVLNGCEFYGWTKEKAMIEATSERRLDAITIDNCYFHDCMKSVVFVENTGYNDLSITNSTFANITTSANFSAGVIDSRATSGSILVDHCTFYNVQAMNTDYAAIGKVKLTSGAVVSNCIFALSEPGASSNRTIRDVVAANNCLVYNYTADSGYGMQSNVTKTGCFIADPLFTDAASGDFSYPGNWVTMNLSPARGAATDGSDLGDPRWYSAETLPTTDFTSPYQFIGIKALLAGNIRLNASNHIEYYDNSVCGTATWKIQATKAATLQVTLNMESGSSSGHKFQVDVLDADGENVGMLAEPSQSESDGDIELSGTIRIPAAGNYTVVLSNLTPWSSAKIESITFSALGGAATDLPATLDPTKAVLSTLAYTEGGELYFTPDPDSKNLVNEWAMWKVNVASNSTFLFTMNVTSTNTQSYKITILDEESVEYDAFEKKPSSGAQTLTHYFYLEAGEYYVKVQNTTSWSNGHVVSLVVTEPDILVLDDNATDNSYLTTHENEVADIQITRTLLPGMYNTICLPFPVNSISALQEALGCEAELLQMSSAAIEGSVLTLEFSADGSMYQGKHFLIKPAKKVINPVFKSASIKRLTAGSTSGTAANFIGTFIKTTIPEDPNNLFLGANNNLYFPEGGDMPIKGMRAYFAVTGSSGAPVRQARIVAQGNVATEVELINGQLPSEFGGNDLRKSIENGQLIIIRDGVQYNALGVRVK